MDDVVLHTCGPAELEARIRLAIGRAGAHARPDDPAAHVIHRGEVVVDDATYTARIGGRPLDLTFKEFELLKFLAQHPGRVFTREQLLQEVWGYDYFGGTRTVDVHVRRLRAKLGPEHEHADRHRPQRRLPLRGAPRDPPRAGSLGASDPVAKSLTVRETRAGVGRLDHAIVPDPGRRRHGLACAARIDSTRPLAEQMPTRPTAVDGACTLSTRRTGHRARATAPRSVVVGGDAFALLHGGDLDLVVRPTARGRGVGSAAARRRRSRRTAAEADALWSHGDHPAAARLARGATASNGSRELWVMRRPTSLAAARARGAPTASPSAAYRARATPPSCCGSTPRPSPHHPEQGSPRRGRPRRPDGRAVVGPGRAAGRHRRRPDARLPLDQAARRARSVRSTSSASTPPPRARGSGAP